MRPGHITPLILTLNEAPNLARLLQAVSWAIDVVVVDSFSTDETVAIAKSFPNVRVFQRAFDNHAAQWNFGVRETGIVTDWILSMDADYVPGPQFQDEVGGLDDADVVGYRAHFDYAILGKRLRGTAYPPVCVLIRRGNGAYEQDGHTQRWKPDGEVRDLRTRFVHDDRKPLRSWVVSQNRYTQLEVEKIRGAPWSQLSFPDRVRRVPLVAPVVMFFYCLFVKGNILDGRAGLYYATQRAFAELLLSLYLMEAAISKGEMK